MGKGKRNRVARRAKREAEATRIAAQNQNTVKNLLRRKMFWAVAVLIVLAIPCVAVISGSFSKSDVSTENKVTTSSDTSRHFLPLPQENKSAFAKMTDVKKETVFLLSPQLQGNPDVAKLNLLCAKGLNGSENLNIDKCLKTLDEWAAYVKHETDRNFHRFKENPGEYYNSEAYFRMAMLVTVLQQDYGVRYNLKLSQLAKEIDWKDAKSSRYAFLHGLLTEDHKGTCASMPVLYMAVGQRLGYPLNLVCAKSHVFLRWEDDKERVNLEATGSGLSIHPDEYYRKWLKFTPEDRKNKYYLKSLSPTEEYALFLEFRADILLYNGCEDEAERIYKKILEYAPDNPYVQKRLNEVASHRITDQLQRAEHEKTNIHREQLAGIELINQILPQLELIQKKELIALNQKFFKKKNVDWSTIEYAKGMDYRMNQILFDSHVKSKMSTDEQFRYQNEVEHVKKLNAMLKHELSLWKNQMECGMGAPVTTEQINMLLTKISRPGDESYERYQEHQRELKYKRIREHSPDPKREIARCEEMAQKNRWSKEELEIQERIRLANIQRSIADAKLDNLKNMQRRNNTLAKNMNSKTKDNSTKKE